MTRLKYRVPRVKRPPNNPHALPTELPAFVAGDLVRARWRNGRFYNATYMTVSIKPGRHIVMFADTSRYYASSDVRPARSNDARAR